ncbi:MAG: recombination mediator RecR [Actinomycetes bacterium]
MSYPPSLQSVIDELGRFPGVGPKSAQRIAFWLMRQPDEDARRLVESILSMKSSLSLCPQCCNISENNGVCSLCSDSRRDGAILCVVEEPRDVLAIERSNAFRGRYHVLHGLINPLEGVTPDRLKVRELLQRLHDDTIHEVILSLSPTVEGDATTLYLSKQLADTGLRVTQVATGLPVGGDMEFADDQTIGRALEGRRVLSQGLAN